MYQTIENNYSEGIFVQLHQTYVQQKGNILLKYIFVSSTSHCTIKTTTYSCRMYLKNVFISIMGNCKNIPRTLKYTGVLYLLIT